LLAFVIFQMVKIVNRIRSAEAPPPAVTPEDIVLLREIRDSLQNKKGD
jgi:large conductance mechanosensitive channel